MVLTMLNERSLTDDVCLTKQTEGSQFTCFIKVDAEEEMIFPL